MLNSFKVKIIKPKFWDKNNIIVFFLFPLTLITRLIILIKKSRNKYKSKIKTICVGNIYIGGTGKTQLVVTLAGLLKNKYKVFTIKKKYQNQIDEQKLLADKTNLILPDSRVNGLKQIKSSKNNIAIFDDGLQDKTIEYDLSIVCFSSISGIGNGKLLPAGPLRENLSEISKYDAVLINGEKNKILEKKIRCYNQKIKIFYSKYILKNKRNFTYKGGYLAFCGIGTPENFFNLLKENKIKVSEKIIFPDHFDYNDKDINKIKKIALSKNLKIVTTEKDFMKIKNFKNHNIKFTNVDLNIKNKLNFKKFIFNYL